MYRCVNISVVNAGGGSGQKKELVSSCKLGQGFENGDMGYSS